MLFPSSINKIKKPLKNYLLRALEPIIDFLWLSGICLCGTLRGHRRSPPGITTLVMHPGGLAKAKAECPHMRIKLCLLNGSVSHPHPVPKGIYFRLPDIIPFVKNICKYTMPDTRQICPGGHPTTDPSP
jgi:hypothetical protein